MNRRRIVRLTESNIADMVSECISDILSEGLKLRKNDEGECVPEKCGDCGGKVGVYIQGEPIFKCSKCGKCFGTVPFPGTLG